MSRAAYGGAPLLAALAVAAAACIAAAAAVAPAAHAQSAEPPVVAIGALMTEPGQEFDDANRTAVLRYAVDRFNEQSAGFDLALNVTMITRGSEPAKLVEAYDGGAGPLFYIGPTTSQGLENIREDEASMDVLGKTILVSPSSEAPQLAIAGDRIFRLAINVERQGAILVGEMESAGIGSLITVARDDAWGRQLAEFVNARAAESGISSAANITFSNSTDAAYWQDIARQVENSAAGSDSTGVFFAGYGQSYPSMAAAGAGSAALGETAWFAPSTALVASSPLPAGAVRDFSAAVGLTILEQDVPESGLTRAIDANLSSPDPVSFYEYSAYDSVFVLGGAIAAAGGPSADAASVAAALPDAALNYTGAIGGILLDKNGDLRAPDSFTVWKADRGTGELAESGTTATPVTRIGALVALGYQDWPDDLTLDGLRLAAADYNEGADDSLVKLIAYNITGRNVSDMLRAAHDGGDGPSIYVGPSLSSRLASIADYANDTGIVLFSTGSEAESLSIPDDRIFRMAVSTDRQAAYMGRTMADRGMESVVMLLRNDEWGLSLNRTLAETLSTLGVDVAATVPFAPDGEADWPRVIERASAAVAANNATMLVAFVGLINDLDGLAAAAAMDPASRAALTGEEWFVTTSTVSSVGFPAIQDPTTAAFASDVVNMTAIDNDVVWNNILPESLSSPANCGAYDDAVAGNYLRAYFECNVPGTWFYEFAAYDTLFVLGDAIRSSAASGDAASGDAAAAVAAAIPAAAEAHVGILGDIALNANGDLLTPDRFGIWYVKNGTWTDTGIRKSTPVVDIGALAAVGDKDYPDDLTVRALRQAVEDYNNAESRGLFVNLAVHNITGRDALAVLSGAHGGGTGPFIYVGPTLSSNLARVAGPANDHGVVLFSPGSEAQSLAVAGDSIFRMTISSARQGALIGGMMADAGVESAVLLVRDDEWGRSLNASIGGALREGGAEVAATVAFAAGGEANWTRAVSDVSAAIAAAAASGGDSPASVGVAFVGVENDQNSLAAAWQAASATALTDGVRWFVTPSGISSSPRIPDDAARSFATAANMTGIAIDVGDSAARAALDAAVPGLSFYEYAAYDTLHVLGGALEYNLATGREHTQASVGLAIPVAAKAYEGVLGDVELDANGDLLAPDRFAVWRVADGVWTDTGETRRAPAPAPPAAPAGCGDEGTTCITLGELHLPEADALAPRINGEVHAAYELAVRDYNAERAAENSTLRLRLETVTLAFASPTDGVAAAYDGGDGIVAYLGPTFSSVAAALEQFTGDSRTVMVSPTSQATSQPSHARDDGLFRLSLNDNYEADLLAIAANREGVGTVVPVVITAYGPSYEQEVRRESESLEMDVLDTVHIPHPNQDQSGTVAEINSRVAAAVAAGADPSSIGLLVVSFSQELHDIAHYAVEYPLLRQVKWFEPGHLFPPQPIEDPETLRLAQVAAFHSISWDLPQTPKFERVHRTLTASGGVEPQHYAYSAYDSVYLLADAANRSMAAAGGGAYTGADVAARMHAAAAGLEGLLGGDLRLDANGDRVSPSQVTIWRTTPGTGAWTDTGDQAELDRTCSISLSMPELAFGNVGAGGTSDALAQSIGNTGTLPLDGLEIEAGGWLDADGAEVLPANATSIMVGEGGDGWKPLGALFMVEPEEGPTEAMFRLGVPQGLPPGAAGPASQLVTYTASCEMPG